MTYMLIHGAWHGAWCWYKTIPLLEAAGHRVIAPDLPGHGSDPTPANRVSLSSYTNHILGILEQEETPVILVGHSMAGAVISRVAEQRPQAPGMLVYLAGYLLGNGDSVLQATRADTGSRIRSNLIFPDDPASVQFRPDGLRETFYNDCGDEDVALAFGRIGPQPQSPLRTTLQLDEHPNRRTERVYIETLQDRAVSLAAQRRMVTARPCDRVITMDTGHCPFFSAPETLVQHLTGL